MGAKIGDSSPTTSCGWPSDSRACGGAGGDATGTRGTAQGQSQAVGPGHSRGVASGSATGTRDLIPGTEGEERRGVSRIVAFYVSPHQDDWQFFRGEQAWVDLRVPGVRVVFLYTTAGDAGQVDGWWEARERGALASIRAAIPPAPLTMVVRTVAGHPITVWECGNSASYCLRLPDGVGTQSLSNLRDGAIPALTAIDGSTTYRGWNDLVGTLRGLLALESSLVAAGHPWVNAPDYERRRNPREHPDHEATGDAFRAFLAGTYRRAWWVGHDTSRRPPNLGGSAILRKRKLFEAYSQTIVRETTANGLRVPPNEAEWLWWGDRSYVTLRQADETDE